MMVGLAAVSEVAVRVLLTDKWLGCVPFMQLLCIVYAMYPIHTANLQSIKAMGKSGYFLKLEVIKKILGIIVLIITLPYGVYMMALGQVGVAIVSTFINSFPNRLLLNYSYKEQIKDILPALLISLVMFAIVYPLKYLSINIYLLLLIQILLGVIVYFGLAILFKLESLNYLINMLKDFKKRRKS